VRPLCCVKKYLLLFHGEKLDIVYGANRLGVPDSIHWVFRNQIIHHGRTEQRTHGDICLPNGRTGIVILHQV
jgi:hypothetical protein